VTATTGNVDPHGDSSIQRIDAGGPEAALAAAPCDGLEIRLVIFQLPQPAQFVPGRRVSSLIGHRARSAGGTALSALIGDARP
jgi:hypothetical protein